MRNDDTRRCPHDHPVLVEPAPESYGAGWVQDVTPPECKACPPKTILARYRPGAAIDPAAPPPPPLTLDDLAEALGNVNRRLLALEAQAQAWPSAEMTKRVQDLAECVAALQSPRPAGAREVAQQIVQVSQALDREVQARQAQVRELTERVVRLETWRQLAQATARATEADLQRDRRELGRASAAVADLVRRLNPANPPGPGLLFAGPSDKVPAEEDKTSAWMAACVEPRREQTPKLVFLASPFRGFDGAESYALKAMADSLRRGEAPFVPHLLYPKVMPDDHLPSRELGVGAAMAWLGVAERLVLYVDHGISAGMRSEIQAAALLGVETEKRKILGIGVA